MDQDLVDYFIKETDKKFEKIDKRFDKVDSKLDMLFKFKWQIIGGAGIASFLITLAVELYAHTKGSL